MRTKPPLATGLLSGAVIGVALLSIHLILDRAVRQQPIGPNLFLMALLLLITLLLLAIWLYCMVELVTLRYAVDRNGVAITTLFRRVTIPHGEILALDPSPQADADLPFRGISWPGYMHGAARHPELGELTVLATEPLPRQLLLQSASVSYGISPRDPEAFRRAYARHRELGALESLPHGIQPRTMAAWPLWRDRAYWLALGLGLAANLALVAYAIARYDQLPAIIPMHWDAQGQIARLAPKAWVFALPAIGALALAVNLALSLALSFRERFASRLLAWASVAIQAGLWWAALGILAP